MCIADSVCVFPLSCSPCGEITDVEQSVNREEREVPTPLWIDDNTSLGKRTSETILSLTRFIPICGGPDSSC